MAYKKRALLLPAGELRERLTFLERKVTVVSGISTESWEPAFTCWGKAEPLSSREYWEAVAVNRENETRFTIRYRSGVDASMRIQYAGQVFDITSVIDPDTRHVKLEMLATSNTEKKG